MPQMAASAHSWDQFALLLIDVQNDFWTDEMAEAYPDYQQNVGNLLTLCRQEQIDIVHLRARFKENKSDWMVKYRFLEGIPCIEGTPGAGILSCATEEHGEEVIYKQTFDGFLSADLQSYLARNNKRFLLVGGLITSVCVLLTAAAAAQRGFLVSVVEDCCADSPQAHNHTLAAYPFVFSRTTTEQIITDKIGWNTQLNELIEA